MLGLFISEKNVPNGFEVDAVEKRKFFPRQESNPGHPAGSPSLHRLSYPDSDNTL
jgi:hypothetical protein